MSAVDGRDRLLRVDISHSTQPTHPPGPPRCPCRSRRSRQLASVVQHPLGRWAISFRQACQVDHIHPDREGLNSGDPSDEALAFSERAAPPSPLQAGAPAWMTPGLLRSPLHHQGRRLGGSRGACRSGFLRGRRSRPGHNHAGAPARRGLGGVEYSKDARGRFGGGYSALDIRYEDGAATLEADPRKGAMLSALTRRRQSKPAPLQAAGAQAPVPVLPAAGRMSRIRTCANCAPSATHRRN